MEKLLSALKTMPEYTAVLDAVNASDAVALTGIGQINRSHLIAALHQDISRPIILICQDDLVAKRLQEELKAFIGTTVPVLPGRELTLYDAAVASRGWEQKRLRQFYDLINGINRIQIMTWEALSLYTMPPSVLRQASFRLEIGQTYNTEELLQKLVNAGYSRCPMVEGPGQFAVRGGIVDIFSPAADQPFRAEFFGDELDTMGYFDPDTQRRTENIESIGQLTTFTPCE